MGTTAGGVQVKPFTEVKSGLPITVLRDLDLSNLRQVFVTVKGYNEAGLYSTSTSNGILISRVSAGLPPLKPLHVYDGTISEADL